jgi:DtxR family Mn-dependent transcriptional regulator
MLDPPVDVSRASYAIGRTVSRTGVRSVAIGGAYDQAEFRDTASGRAAAQGILEREGCKERTVPTIPTENYLIAIQTLHDDEIRCIPARIAELVGVSPPTVTEALKRMARDGYIHESHDPEVTLTERGRELVVALMRRHRIVERWLTDTLGLDWASAHEEAHRLEHAISDTVAERLWSSMGFPSGCPHGNPILPVGQLPRPDQEQLRLRDVPTGETVILARISERAEEQHELIAYFEEKGFHPGVEIRVEDRAPLNGPITVRVDGRIVAVGDEIASYLWVRRVQSVSGQSKAAPVAART